MQIKQNVPLVQFSTMRLGGEAAYVAEIHSRNDVSEAVAWAVKHQLPLIMVGMGSNIVWRDEGFQGLLLVNKLMGYEEIAEDGANHYLTLGSGENWDSVVARSVAAGLTGIEALSLVPGTVGGTPIQNVGAYGQEIAQTLVSVEAYDLHTQKFLNIPNEECGFGYRTSRFKTNDRGRFLIAGITLHLSKGSPEPPFYSALQAYLEQKEITAFTPKVIRDAVIAIRSSKLPDPKTVANNGSFFANPIIDQASLTQMEADYPGIVCWPTADGQAKLSAAWLVEQAGFKDYHDNGTGMATWPTQSLVLVNEHAKTTADLLKFKKKIIDTVQAKFGVTLEQEPELLP
jgi:UDP-N-acetylmuramate dehydrogenase